MIEISFGTFISFGIIWAIQLLVQIETLSRLRETQKQLYTAVRKFAIEFDALRKSHEAHLAGEPEPIRATRRRSTDVADWVVDSGISNAGTSAR